jgi:hypothetical protein
MLFKELDDLINQSTDGKARLIVTDLVNKTKTGSEVYVGGEIKALMQLFEDEPAQAIVDDEIGDILVSIHPQIYKKSKSKFKPGNIVIIKGFVGEFPKMPEHPENLHNEKRRYVTCTAIKVVKEA